MKGAAFLSLLVFVCCGCDSEHSRQAEAKPEAKKSFTIVDYGSADSRQEPTLRLGGKVEVRTPDGSPVIIRSQEAQQKRATEEQRKRLETAK